MRILAKNILFCNIMIFVYCNYQGEIQNNPDLDSLNRKELITTKTHISNWPLDSFICNEFDVPVGNADGKGPYISRVDGKKYASWNVSVPFAINYSLGIHPGEDWGGSGPSESDSAQPVYAIAKGVVIDAKDYFPPWGNIVSIRHIFKSKSKIDTVFSIYIHLQDVYVKQYDLVNRRDSIGTIGNGGVYRHHLHFEIRKNSMKDYGSNFWPSSDDKSMQWVKTNYELPSKFIKAHRSIN